MKKAGAANLKILNKDNCQEIGGKPPISQHSFKAPQLPHSAKTLSAKSLHSAKLIQQISPESMIPHKDTSASSLDRGLSSSRRVPALSAHAKPPLPGSSRSRPQTGISAHSVTILGEPMEQDIEEDEWREPVKIQRRVSWAFEQPLIPKTKEISLSETKALLRSQMRMRTESIVPPDFIYLTVNAIQNSMKPSEVTSNTEQNMLDAKKAQVDLKLDKIDTRLRKNRPSSSPSKIDPRTRVAVEKLDLSPFRDKQPDADTLSEVSEIKSVKGKPKEMELPPTPSREVYATKCQVKPIKTKQKLSVHPKHIRTTLPRGRVIRPISASVSRKEPPEPSKQDRPITAPQLRVRPDTASSLPSQIAASMPGVQPPRRKPPNVGTTGNEVNIVPMLMYPPDMKEKLAAKLKEKRQQRHDDLIESASEIGLGKVSQYNDPMRSHVKFELRTHNQELKHITETEKLYKEQQRRDEVLMERKKRHLWTAKAKAQQDLSRVRSAPVGSVASS